MATKNIKINFTGLSYDGTSTFSVTSNGGDGPTTVTFNDLTHTGSGYDFTISDSATSITVASTNGVCITTSDPATFSAAGVTPTQTPIPETPTQTPVPVTPTSTPTIVPDTPSPTPTSDPVAVTPTPTPSGQPVEEFYDLEKCTDSSEARTANTTDSGAFTNGDIVIDSSGAYYTVVGVTNRISGDVGTVTSTALSECPSAPAEFQPSVTTYAADPVGTETATMNGTINDVGNPNYTEKGFVYVFGSGTPTIADNKLIVSGTLEGDFSKELTGLTPSSQYTYKAYAINSVGVTLGDNRVIDTNGVSWYSLQRCSDQEGGFTSGQTIEDLQGLGTNDRVTAEGETYKITGTQGTEGISVGSITLECNDCGCPATERWYNYEECDGGGITGVAKWPSGSSLNSGNSFFFNECFRITTETTGPNVNDFDLTGYEIYNDCTDCNNDNQPTQTPTPTPTETVAASTDTPTPTPVPSYYLFDECEGGGQVVAQITAPLDGNLRYVDFTVSPTKYYTYTGNSVNPSGYAVNNNLQSTGNTSYGCPSVVTSPPVPATYTTNPGSSTSVSETGSNSLTFSIAVGSSPFTFKAKMTANSGAGTANVTLAINGETITTGTQSLSAAGTSNITTTGSITLPANNTYTAVITLDATSSGGFYSTVGQLVEA